MTVQSGGQIGGGQAVNNAKSTEVVSNYENSLGGQYYEAVNWRKSLGGQYYEVRNLS